MLDKSGIIKRLLLADQRGQEELDALGIRLGVETPLDWALPGPAEFRLHLHRYVLAKLLLDDEEPVPETHELAELCKLSVAKAGRLNPNEATLLDVSRHCGATTSAMTKKVLLFMNLGKALGVSFDGYDTAEIETTEQLADVVSDLVAARDSAAGESD